MDKLFAMRNTFLIEVAKEDSITYSRFLPVELAPWMCGLISDPEKLYGATVGLLPLDIVPGGGLIKVILKKFVIKLIRGFCQAVTGHAFEAADVIQERKVKAEVKSALAKDKKGGGGGGSKDDDSSPDGKEK